MTLQVRLKYCSLFSANLAVTTVNGLHYTQAPKTGYARVISRSPNLRCAKSTFTVTGNDLPAEVLDSVEIVADQYVLVTAKDLIPRDKAGFYTVTVEETDGLYKAR